MGFRVLATGGTATAIRRMGVPVERIRKLSEGSPNVVERIEAGEVELVINTPTGSGARADGYEIRRAAIGRGIPCITTMSGASAAQRAIRARRAGETSVISLQELHGEPAGAPGEVSRRDAPERSDGADARAVRAAGRPRLRRRAARRLPPDRRRGRERPRAPAGAVLHAERRARLGRAGRTNGPTCRGPSPTRAPARATAAWRSTSCSRRSGPGTGRLAGLAPGDGLALVGPLGIGFDPADAPGRALLVGGGIGVAPLLCLEEQLLRAGEEPRVLLGFRTAAHAQAAALFGGAPAVVTDDGSVGRQALVTELLARGARRRPGAHASLPAGRRRCSRP